MKRVLIFFIFHFFFFVNLFIFSLGTIRLFPISRIENYEEEDDEYTDKTTKTLCYVLGGFYCLVGAISVFGLVSIIILSFSHGLLLTIKIILILIIKLGTLLFQWTYQLKNIIESPKFLHILFPHFMCFQSCFYVFVPNRSHSLSFLPFFLARFSIHLFPLSPGTFEFQPLSYFVIFEIPTFILFSILIFMIFAFKKLVYKKGFFPGNPLPILFLGWPFVWGLWVLVTIVYSEVILGFFFLFLFLFLVCMPDYFH